MLFLLDKQIKRKGVSSNTDIINKKKTPENNEG
jgi:hypothetical protein